TLPAEHFVPGQNVIQFMANLRACDWDCRDPLWTEIWAVVHQDSRIHLKSSSLGDDMTLDHFPLQLDDSTTLVFPAQPSSQEWMGAFAFLTRLGRDLPDGVDRFTIITADTVVGGGRLVRGVGGVGRAGGGGGLAEVADKIFFPTFVLAGRPIGLVQVMPSPWNAAYPLLVVTGQQDEGAGWALLLLGDSRRSAWLQGDLAVVDQQGIVTTLNTTASPTPVSGVIEGTRPTPGWVFWALAGLLGFPVLALAAVVVRRYISARLQAGGKDGSDQ
ncbi:MAG: cellulose biosynthesis cyclic di-GMP-binding regulatory protein BcsB, partial [Chloroflexi bacterium]|nr:cellulose biosynthesis cyclic di-GMP-binding regulatory protein BcsB [Chloroflexota bacterium]